MDLGFGLSVSLMEGWIHSSGQAGMGYGSLTVVWRSVQLKRDSVYIYIYIYIYIP